MKIRYATLLAIFALVGFVNSAIASDTADVTAAVHQFFDNLDDSTIAKAVAVCDSPVSIIDEFPPHHWYGPDACTDWWKAVNAYDRKEGITDAVAKLGVPWSVDVTGERAYFVGPATYIYKQHGKTVQELHAVFTVALRRTQSGWRIAAWTWSKH